MFKTRLLSGIVLVLVALLTICSGGTVLYMTVLCLSLIGAGELFRVMKVREDKWNLLEITGYAGVVTFAVPYAAVYAVGLYLFAMDESEKNMVCGVMRKIRR